MCSMLGRDRERERERENIDNLGSHVYRWEDNV